MVYYRIHQILLSNYVNNICDNFVVQNISIMPNYRPLIFFLDWSGIIENAIQTINLFTVLNYPVSKINRVSDLGAFCRQCLYMYRGPGGTEHETPVETWNPCPAAHHWSGGGQLPRNHGTPPHRQGTPGLPRSVDPHQPLHWWKYSAEIHVLWWKWFSRSRRTSRFHWWEIYSRIFRRSLLCKFDFNKKPKQMSLKCLHILHNTGNILLNLYFYHS